MIAIQLSSKKTAKLPTIVKNSLVISQEFLFSLDFSDDEEGFFNLLIKTTGYNRFASQCQAYKPLMEYLEANNLVLSEAVIDACLKNNTDFQMQIYIERLVTGLKKLAQADSGQVNPPGITGTKKTCAGTFTSL